MHYYYKVDRRTLNPLPFSNFASKTLVRDRYAVPFVSAAQFCCDDETTVDTEFNFQTEDKKRYYVRMDSAGKPINNSLVVGVPNGNYSDFVRVYAVNCCIQTLQPPTNLIATVGDEDASVAYTSALNATSYDFQLATNSSFVGADSGTDVTSPVPLASFNLINGTTYWFRMRSTAMGYNTSAWSDPITFVPVVGVLTAPFSLIATPNSGGASLSYSNDVNATNQLIQVSTDNTFATGVIPFSDVASPAALTGLTNGLTYYVRMKSTAPTYADSPYSSTISFTPAAVVLHVFYGNKSTGTDLNQAGIEAGTQLAYSPGADISVPFFTNAPTFNWAAWPSSETGITNYFVNSLDFGGFGGGSPWNSLVTVGSYIFVINQYATQYPSPDPVIFKH